MFRKPAPDADYGALPENYEELIKSKNDRFWGDSLVTSYLFGRPRKGYFNRGLLFGGGVSWKGYVVPFSFNHKKFGRLTFLGLIWKDTVKITFDDQPLLHFVE